MTLAENYFRKRKEVNNRPEVEPSVTIHDLSIGSGRGTFFESLRSLPTRAHLEPWVGNTDEEIMLEALDRGVIVDQLPLMLADRAKTIRPDGWVDSHASTVTKYQNWFSNPENGVYVELNFEGGQAHYIHTLPEEELYHLMFSRNQYAISPEAQELLRRNRYAFAGASVGGMVAWLFLMSGNSEQIIGDGGPMQAHSANRLSHFKLADVGSNKAYAYARAAYRFFPFANIDAVNQNIDVGNINNFIQGATAVIEAIDSISQKPLIQREGLKETGLVYAPTDLGLGSALLQVITESNGIFNGYLTDDEIATIENARHLDQQAKTMLAIKIIGKHNIPPELMAAVMRAGAERLSYWTQPALAAYLSASLCFAAEINRLNGNAAPAEIRINLATLMA